MSQELALLGQPTGRLAALDFLAEPPPGGAFQFVFDRGCVHVFDDQGERDSRHNSPPYWNRDLWVSLIGSTEGSRREIGARAVQQAKSPSPSSLRWRSWTCDQLSSAKATQRRVLPVVATNDAGGVVPRGTIQARAEHCPVLYGRQIANALTDRISTGRWASRQQCLT